MFLIKVRVGLEDLKLLLICYLFLFDTIYLFVSVPQITSTPTKLFRENALAHM